MRRVRKSDNNIAEGAGLDPDKQQLLCQLKASERVLMKVQQERNKLQDAHTQLGEELKGVRAQLSGSVKENQRLRRGIYSKCLNELFENKSLARKSINQSMSVGMLTGRPAEEMPGSTGDLLPKLSQLHERVWQAMRGVAQALWPSHSMPEDLGELAERLQGAQQRFLLWMI